MDITWIAIISAIVMGASAAIIVLFFMKHESLHASGDSDSDAFWPDLKDLARSAPGPNRTRRA